LCSGWLSVQTMSAEQRCTACFSTSLTLNNGVLVCDTCGTQQEVCRVELSGMLVKHTVNHYKANTRHLHVICPYILVMQMVAEENENPEEARLQSRYRSALTTSRRAVYDEGPKEKAVLTEEQLLSTAKTIASTYLLCLQELLKVRCQVVTRRELSSASKKKASAPHTTAGHSLQYVLSTLLILG
jgi:hypothetical protein